jgi:hypothetical protein
MTGATAPNSTTPTAARKGMLTWIATKQDGRWYIKLFHEFDYFKECDCAAK